jgi:hypothetical protein
MHYSQQRETAHFGMFIPGEAADAARTEVSCNWSALREQLLNQWDRITPYELESTNHIRLNIARLIQKKYGISVEMAVNYLRNFERTLPLLGCA